MMKQIAASYENKIEGCYNIASPEQMTLEEVLQTWFVKDKSMYQYMDQKHG